MSNAEAESPSPAAWQCAFRCMMWAFLFFFPVPLAPVEALLPIISWALFLWALRALRGSEPATGALRFLGLSGLVLCAARVPLALTPSRVAERIGDLLLLTAWAVFTLFVWKLAGLVAALAGRAKADALAQSARWRRWAAVLPFFLVGISANAPRPTGWLAFCLFMLVTTCVICLLMGLMASAARLSAVSQQSSVPTMDARHGPPQ